MNDLMIAPAFPRFPAEAHAAPHRLVARLGRRLPRPLAALAVIAALALAIPAPARAAGDEPITVEKTVEGSRLIPISLSGFSGEVDAALRFDLEIGGFKFESADAAQYNVTGSFGANLVGQLSDRISKSVLLHNEYRGTAARAQAHAFADDIIEKITGRKGITRFKIAFKVDTGSTSEIYVSDYDGYNPTQVTTDRSIVAAPCWAPGKRQLFYTSYRLGNPDIYSHDLQTGARRVVARYSGLNTSASVSPDGQRVAMILSKSGSPDLYVANADGSGLRQITQTPEDESSPCWSPDGRSICFVSRLRGRPDLYLVGADGGSPRRLDTIGAVNTTEPDWSPDGKLIVFTSNTGGFSIHTVPARGGAASEALAAGEDPSWAPDSRHVVFARRVGNGRRVVSLLDVQTKRVKDIARLSGSCSQPSWAR
jgi:TolB protein